MIKANTPPANLNQNVRGVNSSGQNHSTSGFGSARSENGINLGTHSPTANTQTSASSRSKSIPVTKPSSPDLSPAMMRTVSFLFLGGFFRE